MKLMFPYFFSARELPSNHKHDYTISFVRYTVLGLPLGCAKLVCFCYKFIFNAFWRL